MSFKTVIVNPDLEDILPDFIRNTINEYDVMLKAYESQDFGAMGRVCHKLLGSVLSFGFEELDQFLRTLQDNIRVGDEVQIELSFLQLQKYIEYIEKTYEH